MKLKRNVWMSWSTGKDSAYALMQLQKRDDLEVTGLFTTVTESFGRVSMHATRESLLRQQASEMGLPVEIVKIPAGCSNEFYENQMKELIKKAKVHSVSAMAFGDLFLEDVRQYREKLLEGSSIEPIFPLWKYPTNELAIKMIEEGIRAVLTCIDPKKLDSSFAGRIFDESLIQEFPNDVDPCGERGEFHTFVFDSPLFQNPIDIRKGEVVERDGFVFTDVHLDTY